MDNSTPHGIVEDSDDIILRLYEAHGGRGTARVRLGFPFKSAKFCNLLEDNGPEATVEAGAEDGVVSVAFTPFQIISLKVR